MNHRVGNKRILYASAGALPKTLSVGTKQTTAVGLIGNVDVSTFTFTDLSGDSPTQWNIAFNPPADFAGGDYFTFEAGGGNSYYCWYTIDGVGDDPASSSSGLSGYIGILVSCLSTDDANAISNNTLVSMQNASVANSFIYNVNGTLQFQTQSNGSYATPNINNPGLGFATVINAGNYGVSSPGGIYFYNASAGNPATGYYVWANMGTNTDPGPQDSGNATNAIQVNFGGYKDMYSVASAFWNAITNVSISGLTVNIQDSTITITNSIEGSIRSTGQFGPGVCSSTTDSGGFGIRDYIGVPSIQIFDSQVGPYYTWLNIDNLGSDPGLTGTAIQVPVSGTSTLSSAASTISSAWQNSTPFPSSSAGASFVVTNPYVGANSASVSSSGSDFTISNPAAGVGNIDTATNIITLVSHGYTTGLAVKLSLISGIMPTGLSDGTTYYIIKVDANHFKLASSKANALAGTSVTITVAAYPGILKFKPV